MFKSCLLSAPFLVIIVSCILPSETGGCPTFVKGSGSAPMLQNAEHRYALFKSRFEPVAIDNDVVRRAYRFSCWKDKAKAYIITLIEEDSKNRIIKQEFSINWKEGYPLWVKSEKVSTRKISNERIQKLMKTLSQSFNTKSPMGTPGIAGHFWLEDPLNKEASVIDLHSERFEGEEKFLTAISKYVPYLPEMPGAFYSPPMVIIPVEKY